MSFIKQHFTKNLLITIHSSAYFNNRLDSDNCNDFPQVCEFINDFIDQVIKDPYYSSLGLDILSPLEDLVIIKLPFFFSSELHRIQPDLDYVGKSQTDLNLSQMNKHILHTTSCPTSIINGVEYMHSKYEHHPRNCQLTLSVTETTVNIVISATLQEFITLPYWGDVITNNFLDDKRDYNHKSDYITHCIFPLKIISANLIDEIVHLTAKLDYSKDLSNTTSDKVEYTILSEEPHYRIRYQPSEIKRNAFYGIKNEVKRYPLLDEEFVIKIKPTSSVIFSAELTFDTHSPKLPITDRLLGVLYYHLNDDRYVLTHIELS